MHDYDYAHESPIKWKHDWGRGLQYAVERFVACPGNSFKTRDDEILIAYASAGEVVRTFTVSKSRSFDGIHLPLSVCVSALRETGRSLFASR
jgi:hypothetical protein